MIKSNEVWVVFKSTGAPALVAETEEEAKKLLVKSYGSSQGKFFKIRKAIICEDDKTKSEKPTDVSLPNITLRDHIATQVIHAALTNASRKR